MSNSADNSSAEATSADDCPLPVRDQTINVLVVAVNTALSYLAAPVMYVDTVHAVLCKEFGASAFVYNLPSSCYLLFSAAPLFVGWLLPRAAQLKPIIVTCYAGMAAMTLLVGLVLATPISPALKIALIVFHGACTGIGRTVAVAGEFEVLGRAVAPSRRGRALGLAYGFGPILAIAGSLTAQKLLTGSFIPASITEDPSTDRFRYLFLASGPVLLLATLLATRLIIPGDQPGAKPPSGGPLAGLGEFLSRPVVLCAIAVAILLASGATVISNLSTYAETIFERSAQLYAGILKATLYAFKAIGGLGLGYLLTRTNPKTCVMASGMCICAAAIWAIFTPPQSYFLSFGLLGIGQLSGVYITNYVLCCATPDKMRKYMAFCMLAQVPCAFAGQLLGAIKDFVTGLPSTTSAATGFQASFAAAAVFVLLGLLVASRLPRRPLAGD